MPAPRSVLFAGGGTGGHLYPGIAVAEELVRRYPDLSLAFCGTSRPIEVEILGSTRFAHQPLPVLPPGQMFRKPRVWTRAWNDSCRQLRARWYDQPPEIVVGLGGYAMTPAIRVLRGRSRIVLLEQNAIPGRAVHWLARLADHICTSFEPTPGQWPHRVPVTWTGNPLRQEIATLADESSPPPNSTVDRDAAYQSRPTLLILGGSQGAHSLNAAMLDIVKTQPELFAGWQLIHQTGPADELAVHSAYQQAGIRARVDAFFTDLPTIYRGTTLAIARAGAGTLAELAAAGIATVLVPYPQSARQHQLANALAFAQVGGAIVVREEQTTAQTAAALQAAIRELLPHADRRAAMSSAIRGLAKPHAAADIVNIITQLAGWN